MKKKIMPFLAGTIMCLSTATFAQDINYPYDFEFINAPNYEHLSNAATQIIGSTGWDDEVIVFNLPQDFIFTYLGDTVTTWSLDTYGGLYPNDLNMDLDLPYILGVVADYMDNGNSEILLEITGNLGSRIAKIEFKNVGFYSALSPSDVANFQIWLYENSSIIEYRIGPNNVDPLVFDDDILVVGLGYPGLSTTDSVYFHVVNFKNSTNSDSIIGVDMNNPFGISFEDLNYHTEYPISLSTFRFKPKVAPNSIRNTAKNLKSGKLYPNPALDIVSLELNTTPKSGASIAIFTLNGQKVLTQNIINATTPIEIEGLAKGIYMLSYMPSNGAVENYKLIKK